MRSVTERIFFKRSPKNKLKNVVFHELRASTHKFSLRSMNCNAVALHDGTNVIASETKQSQKYRGIATATTLPRNDGVKLFQNARQSLAIHDGFAVNSCLRSKQFMHAKRAMHCISL